MSVSMERALGLLNVVKEAAAHGPSLSSLAQVAMNELQDINQQAAKDLAEKAEKDQKEANAAKSAAKAQAEIDAQKAEREKELASKPIEKSSPAERRV